MNNIFIKPVKNYLQTLHNTLCSALTQEDGTVFKKDLWEYAQGKGGGDTRILANGPVIEKAGVNFSHIQGQKLPVASLERQPQLTQTPFEALGISLVIHPLNPYVPTVHANLRFIITNTLWWFGGGFDLTPYYGFMEDCRHWHQNIKNNCDIFDKNIYPEYKKNCDDYFYLPHRKEPRGIGGLFFDDLNKASSRKWDFEKCFDFICTIGNCFLEGYLPILIKRKNTPYGKREQDFQYYRRGRYVEFNLLYDRGTRFGLESGGRTESILMSLPPKVHWEYDYPIEPGSPEDRLYKEFLIEKNWLS